MPWLLVPALTAALLVAAAPVDRARAYHHYSLALQALLNGDRAGALEDLRTARAYDRTAPEIAIDLAHLLRRVGRLDEALDPALEGVRLAPDNADARRALALVYRELAESSADEQAFAHAAEQLEVVARLEPDDAPSLLHLAQLYGAAGDGVRAMQALERYVARAPDDAEALLRLGARYLELGQPERAVVSFSRALALRPESVHARISLADAYARGGRNTLAVESYRQALASDPENVRAHLALGELLLQGGRAPEARDEADAALRQDARNPYALDLRARARHALGDFDAAQADAEHALESSPGDVKLAFARKAGLMRARIAVARHDDALAARILEALLDPANPEAGRVPSEERALLVELGLLRERQARHGAAVAAFARARALGVTDALSERRYVRALWNAADPRLQAEAEAAHVRFPEDASLGVLAAAAREQAGDRKGALALAERITARAASEPESALQLAAFHTRARRYDDAERVLHAACPEGAGCEPGVLVRRADLLARLGRGQEAEALLREALARAPGSAELLAGLGRLSARRDARLDEALATLGQALQAEPGNAATLGDLGFVLYRLGRLEEAEAALRRALAGLHGHALLLDHLGDVVSARGRPGEAHELWRRALTGDDPLGELDRDATRRKLEQPQTAREATGTP
jgi:tetratricopeptide (TPR) repeat protein